MRKPFLEMAQRMIDGGTPPAPVAELIGMNVAEVGPDRAVFEMRSERRHFNPMGTLHGGILCDLADGALAMAWASELVEGESFTTLEVKINFLKPVWETTLRAEAKVIRRGKTVGVVACDIRDESGDIVAHATSTLMTLRGDLARGR